MPIGLGRYRRSEVETTEVGRVEDEIPRIARAISRGWKADVKAPDREAADALADGLDSGQASATLLLSGECQLGFALNAQTESMADLVLMGWSLHDGLLDGP